MSNKSRLVAFLLATCLGVFGSHRFYLGRTTSGFLLLATLVFLFPVAFVWTMIDMFVIFSGNMKDSNNEKVEKWW